MGLAGARNSAVTGLQAQSTYISISADNIANANTTGYKSVKASFSTLVTDSGASIGFSSGGTSIASQRLVEEQGLIESTGRVSDIAISGSGFFSVEDEGGNLLLTRDGAFDVNNNGELTTTTGHKLLGWPLDNDGRKPGETGNTNTTASESVDSLEVVDINSANGTASATTTISAGMNLNASQSVYQGATVGLTFASTTNGSIAQGDIIAPVSGMMEGDSFQLTSDSVTTTFLYGGFARSFNVNEDAIFDASSSSTTFSTTDTGLTDGDKFTITTATSGQVTFEFKLSSPDTASGQFNSMETLAEAIGSQAGLAAREYNGTVLVSSDDANDAITFDDVSGSELHTKLGFGNVVAGDGSRFNTVSGLEAIIDELDHLGTSISNPTSGVSIEIYSGDPLQTLTLTKLSNLASVSLKSEENATNASTDIIVPPRSYAGTKVDTMTIGTSVLVLKDGESTPNVLTVTYGGIAEATNQLTSASAILGATSTSVAFSSGVANNDNLVVTTYSAVTATLVAATYTFTFTTGTASAAGGSFDSLATLADAINGSAAASGNLYARVVDGRLYVASADADQGLSFSAGGGDTANFATSLGLSSVTSSGAAGSRFASVSELQAIIDGDASFSASAISDSTSGANFTFSSSASDTGAELVVSSASSADLLTELGLAATGTTAANGGVNDAMFEEFSFDTYIDATDTATSTGAAPSTVIAVSYDPNDATKNMSGGEVTPDFSRNVRIFDALGTGHDFRMAFVKVGINQWSVEIYALDPSEISGRADGQVATGIVEFNGDGSLRTVPAALSNEIDVSWTTSGSTSTSFTMDLGTAGSPAGTTGATVIGLTDGLRQFDASYNVEFVEQNGVAAGQFNGIEIDEDGTVNAKFSNGEVKPIYKLPVITVPNQNALQAKSGNVFAVTQSSGEVNLKDAGAGGAGVYVPGALEGSTADIAEELTRTIGIQSNYNANATLISTIKDMEDELNRRL